MGFFKEVVKAGFTGYVAGKVAAETIRNDQKKQENGYEPWKLNHLQSVEELERIEEGKRIANKSRSELRRSYFGIGFILDLFFGTILEPVVSIACQPKTNLEKEYDQLYPQAIGDFHLQLKLDRHFKLSSIYKHKKSL